MRWVGVALFVVWVASVHPILTLPQASQLLRMTSLYVVQRVKNLRVVHSSGAPTSFGALLAIASTR